MRIPTLSKPVDIPAPEGIAVDQQDSKNGVVTPPATPPAVSYLSGFFPSSSAPAAGTWRKRYFSESASTATPPNFSNIEMPTNMPPSPANSAPPSDEWNLGKIFGRRHSFSFGSGRIFSQPSDQAVLTPATSYGSVNGSDASANVDYRMRRRSLSMSAADPDSDSMPLPKKTKVTPSLEKDPMSDLSLHGQFLDF